MIAFRLFVRKFGRLESWMIHDIKWLNHDIIIRVRDGMVHEPQSAAYHAGNSRAAIGTLRVLDSTLSVVCFVPDIQGSGIAKSKQEQFVVGDFSD